MLTNLPMKIDTNSKDEDAVLIMQDGYLVAILVRLDDEVHGSACGQWHLEAQFDHLPLTGRLFGTVDEAQEWIASKMDRPDARTRLGLPG